MPVRKQIKYYIGIDIGSHGAIAVRNSANNETIIHVMPVIAKVLDTNKLSTILSKYQDKDCHVVFEDLHALYKASASSTFSFGFSCGAVEALVSAYNLPYTKVRAVDWQKSMFTGIRQIKKVASNKKGFKVDTKAMALISCKRLFPGLRLVAPESTRATKPHDGIVDAILQSEYCKRNYT